MAKLRLCPCCGSEAALTAYQKYDGYQGEKAVYCVTCRSCGLSIEKDSEEAVVEAWNKSIAVSKVDDREVEALKNECEKLIADNRKMKSKIEELTAKLKWYESMNRELEHSNHVLSAQMEVVCMFLSKGDMDE